MEGRGLEFHRSPERLVCRCICDRFVLPELSQPSRADALASVDTVNTLTLTLLDL